MNSSFQNDPASSGMSANDLEIERLYLRRLKRYRLDGGPNPISYLGTKWFYMKVVLAGIAAMILMDDHRPAHLGWMIIGYLIGTVTASLKTLLSLRRLWPIQNQITDWAIVEERLTE